MKKLIGIVKRTLSVFLGTDMPVYAGFATLKISTAVFPLFMLIIAALNMLPGYSPANFLDYVFNVIPDLPEVKGLFLTVMSNLQAQSSGFLASVAALTAIWSASAGVSAIQKGLKKMTSSETGGIRDKLMSVVFTIFLVVLIPALLLFNLLGDSLTSLLSSAASFLGFPGLTGTIREFIEVSGVIASVFSILMVLLIYVYLPGGKRPVKAQLPGAVLTSVGWAVFTWLFSAFIPIFWKSALYGSLASLFLTLIWLQTSILILFLGGALNKVLAETVPETAPEAAQGVDAGTDAGTDSGTDSETKP